MMFFGQWMTFYLKMGSFAEKIGPFWSLLTIFSETRAFLGHH